MEKDELINSVESVSQRIIAASSVWLHEMRESYETLSLVSNFPEVKTIAPKSVKDGTKLILEIEEYCRVLRKNLFGAFQIDFSAFCNIPDEILVHIFSFLKINERARSQRVCLRWRYLLKHQLFATHVSISSAGMDVGNHFLLYLDGFSPFASKTNHSNYNRGISALILRKGNVLDYKAFDTWESSSESAELGQFLNRIESGDFVLMGIRDEGIWQLQESEKKKLETLGSKKIREVGHRYSWAFVVCFPSKVIFEDYSATTNVFWTGKL